MTTHSVSSRAPRVAIIGGGISGLAAAQRVRRLLPHAELRLLEASDRLGGPLHTLRTADSILEQGADSFLIKTPWALELCRELGLAEQLVPVNEHHRRALVVRDGKLMPVPEGFVLMRPQSMTAMLRSPVLSTAGKLRLLTEPFIRAPEAVQDPHYDESVASFATRRLGREAFERLVQPLVAGIFVADATKLSLAATFPEFLQAEREHGSLWRSLRARKASSNGEGKAAKSDGAGSRYGQFVSLRGGLRTLVESLESSLPDGVVRMKTRVDGVAPNGAMGWLVSINDATAPEAFDGVIVASSASRASSLVSPVDAALGERLGRIEYASSAVVTLVYRREQIGRLLDGFGAVVPAIENRQIIAASFLNVKFPEWAPASHAVVRVFMGGVLRPELVDRDDAELISIAAKETATLIGAEGKPLETHVARWRNSMPQYYVGHLKLIDEIDALVAGHRALELAGSGYRGVGIPQCIRSGRAAAERLVESLTPR